ncbi:hypothetical protein VTH82DRAFT_3307 [Thermothelomyces myriococcoides]
MDPIGTAANIIAIIHAANKVVVLCKRFLEVVHDAPNDLRLILVEVSTLKAVLDDLHFLVSCNHYPTTLNTLVREHGPIEGCRKAISELENLLPPESLLAASSKTKAILTALSWLTKESRAKTLIEELREYKATISLALTTDSSQDETVPFLRWVLLELCRSLGRVPAAVYELYRYGGNPTAHGLVQALERTLQAFDRVFILIDALDESLERENLLDTLRTLAVDDRFQNLRLLATSRNYMDIEDTMVEISKPIAMTNWLVNQDIAVYVRSKLENHPKLKRWPKQLKDDVFDALTTSAKGMFRWVVCQIDAIQRLKPEKRVIQNALANLPRNLDETYERAFMDIPEEAQPFVRHVLRWLSTHFVIHKAIPGFEPVMSVDFSPIYIPMAEDISTDILFTAVQQSLSEDDTCDPDFVDSYAFDEDLLREYCGCLVTITKFQAAPGSKRGDYSLVSFAHYTVLEFLESARIRRGPAAAFALDRQQTLLESSKALVLAAIGTADQWDREWPEEVGPEFYNDFETRTPTTFGTYYWYNDSALTPLENPLAPAIGAFRQLEKFEVLSPPLHPHLEMLARMFQVDERGYLARSLLASLGRTGADLACQIDLKFVARAAFVHYVPPTRHGAGSREQWLCCGGGTDRGGNYGP